MIASVAQTFHGRLAHTGIGIVYSITQSVQNERGAWPFHGARRRLRLGWMIRPPLAFPRGRLMMDRSEQAQRHFAREDRTHLVCGCRRERFRQRDIKCLAKSEAGAFAHAGVCAFKHTHQSRPEVGMSAPKMV